MKKLLKSKHLRVTPFRIEVLKVFQKYENAIDIAVIEAELVNFDRITLYRTIKAFLEAGVLHEILISGESKKYAMCPESCQDSKHNHKHVHFHCANCNETYCLETNDFPTIKHQGFVFDSVDVLASGFCAACHDL